MMESSSQPSADASDQVNGVEEQLLDPMEDFSKQLEDIINTYGSVSNLMEEQISILENEEEKLDEEIKTEDAATGVEMSSSPGQEPTAEKVLKGLGKDASLLLQSLDKLGSAEDKVETVLRSYAKLLQEQREEHRQLKVLQNREGLLVKQRDQLQFDHSQGILARSKLESLCRELQRHNKTLKEDMLQKCLEDERKRTEITTHFQNTLVDIQAQIEHHSTRNNKLCQENSDLADKLKSIIEQYEQREESLEKMFRQRDLQQKLSDAKLEEANLRLKEAEEKHSREKEYLLKEAIEKTKKCYTMKEQELQMKKQLVLYSQKFDEFQATLAKSNEVYATFKQEMDKMTKKMKKLEKESNIWKIRFESCSKALTEMIEERSEKGKELELFTLKIAKLETLCRALQDERKVLYDKIKEIRLQGFAASAPLKAEAEEVLPEVGLLPEPEPERNPALTAEMEKLWKEQARLEEFAASLMASSTDQMEDSEDEESSEPIDSQVPVPSKPAAINLQLIKEEPSSLEDGNQVSKEAHLPIKPEVIQSEPKQEPSEQEISKAEPPKDEPNKEEAEKEEPVEQYTPKQNSNKTKPVGQKEVRFKDVETEIVQAEHSSAEPAKEELIAQDKKEDSSPTELPKEQERKEESGTGEPPKAEATSAEPGTAEAPKVEPVKEEPSTSEPVKAEPEPEAAKPQTSKTQEVKSKNSKPQSKKQGSTKKKGAPKGAKKS